MKITDIRDVRGRRLAAIMSRDAYERYLSREIGSILRDAFRSIASDLSDSGITLRDRARIVALLQRIDGLLSGTYARVNRESTAALVDFATVQGEAAHAELGALAIDAGMEPGEAAAIVDRLAPVISSHFVRSVAELPVDGLRLGDWWQAQANGMRLATRRTIQQGLVRGDPLRTIASALYPPRDSTDPAVYRRARAEAQSIVRTATTAVHAQAGLESYASAGADVTGEYELLTARDARVSQICAALDGQVFRYNDPMRKAPPFHINCLPGDSLVTASPDIAAVTKRWYDGEIVTVTTADGHKLTSTPNHPVLTRHGWRATRLLHVGDYVICHGTREGPPAGDNNAQDRMPTIEQVSEAWRARSGVMRIEMPVAAPDFHGDGIDEQIAVIWTDRSLADWMHATANEVIEKTKLRWAGMRDAALSSNGTRRTYPETIALLASCIVRSRNEGTPVDLGHAFESCAFAFGAIAKFDRSLSQNALDSSFGDAQLATDGSAADALAVQPHYLSQVVGVELNPRWQGFVYNLETLKGWYGAQGIITHNCRTTILPMLNYAALGLTPPSGSKAPLTIGSFASWLGKQPMSTREDVLGATRAQWFSDGRMGLQDIIDLDDRVLSLPQLASRLGVAA